MLFKMIEYLEYQIAMYKVLEQVNDRENRVRCRRIL